MAFRSSADARLYLHSLGLHAYTRETSSTATTVMHDSTVFANADGTSMRAKQSLPGIRSWVTTFGGLLDVDGVAGGQYASLVAMRAALIAGMVASYPFTYMPLSTDGAIWLGDGIKTALDASAGITQTVDWAAGVQGTGAFDTNGKILENNTTVTVDTNGTALDNGAQSTNGAVAHLHVTAFSGLTSDAIIIQSSATGSFGGEETTLFTFSSVSGLTSESLSVTGTVPRYLRVKDDVTGTGSISRLVAIARR